jgi:hypothetical protein
MKRLRNRQEISMTSENGIPTKNIGVELLQLETKRIELQFLKRVASDLRSYRKMIGVKEYD